ncbi:helix-turn-helix transcriptional regulator [Sphingomonas lutea]|uniref:Helix-turn-helix transcriptional regulator n=1 Tax=Sphingomonas lutea TaxID=1045317 RepID=A0A7G9SJP1_9SPHN|nr:helix-turn-helix transcriptional regulator [Sphingomonas lutea]QNN68066.1 helix-turn-helix transcriptional regulator [Sphingomonas lutea]
MSDAEQGAASPAEDDMTARVGRLSAGQLDCLRLVNEHLSSKEIAAELSISPHTVDQRIRQSLQILGVERRAQAARIVSQHSGTYQRLIHQSPHIEPATGSDHCDGAVRLQIRTLIAQGGLAELVS